MNINKILAAENYINNLLRISGDVEYVSYYASRAFINVIEEIINREINK